MGETGGSHRQDAPNPWKDLHSWMSYKQLQQGSFRWPPIMDGVMKLSPVEFAALFDGLDWTRVQIAKGILKPSVAA
jgi:transposase